ncbi:hypothetical protein Lal_00005953 [Lupinus albus]|uniref:Putative non-specific serine/threonine protein kinase n=1 Tax=Lupinus albus TaxID=3870 RepID=A0A6A5MXI9_LUPAL|nr:putative non-specific serine/threonine protein kinase [Lupinus albus]KAF1879486.1 hypothetical protein Lal_00005953 [Lupinus albus]
MGIVETRSKVPYEETSSSEEEENSVQGSEVQEKELSEEALGALKEEEGDYGVPENGVGFSSIQNHGLGDDGVVEVVKSRVSETKVSVPRGNDSQGSADCEMNGASSLLKMQASGACTVFPGGDGVSERRDEKKSEEEERDEVCDGKIVSYDVSDMETGEKVDVESEDLSDEGYEFSVGDFVWGKIKSHPWWPGRIYNPSDASDLALKLEQKNRLLVAYFGDGTFAWCHPSQLKPFEENFGDMVKQSSSKGFVNAVQKAVNEVGRLLYLKISHSFVAKKTSSEFAPPMTKNSGIKEGVFVPENGIERFSVAIEPIELLSQAKRIAKVIASDSILELEILKAQLSAFHLSRGGYKLPSYEDPQPVPGLEDSSMDTTVKVGNSAVEAPFQGPYGELCRSPGLSGNRSNFGRKQKSIAQILGEDKDVTDGDESDEVIDAIVSSGRKKRKNSEDYADRNMPSSENNGRSLRSKRKKEAFGNENISGGSQKETEEEMKTKEQNEKGYVSRERKKSKYLSPPFTSPVTGQWKGDIETEYLEFSNEARESKGMANCGVAFQDSFSDEVAIEWELSDGSNYNKQEDDKKKTIDLTKLHISSVEVLSIAHYAAVNPQSPGESTPLEKTVDFISAFRSSLFLRGSYYKVYNKRRPGRKRNTDRNQTDHVSHNHDSEPRKRRKEKSPGTSTVKDESGDENGSAAALFVSFYPVSTLPSKSDLINVYSKFGALNEAETEMFRTNYTARVSFLRTSDAEKALKDSQNSNPFEPSEVTFQLQYHSAGSKTLERDERSKFKPSLAAAKKKCKTPPITPSVSLSWGNEASKLNYIKQKLQGVTSMIEEVSDGISPDTKTTLFSEVKDLLEDVGKMVESSS